MAQVLTRGSLKEVTAEIRVTPRIIAEMFAELDDDGQAKVFVELAHIEGAWDGCTIDQWHAVGRHLRDCDCSTSSARRIIRRIHEGMGDD